MGRFITDACRTKGGRVSCTGTAQAAGVEAPCEHGCHLTLLE